MTREDRSKARVSSPATHFCNVTMSDFEAGVFLIDKPVGPTSFTIVRNFRRALGMKKIGHAGTLDPFASGLLIVCAGRPATKMISSIMEGEKEYLATLTLGVETATQDPEGAITSRHPVGLIGREEIEICLKGFLGDQEQVPPVYSALKHKGKPLYYYARKGIEIIKDPRKISITTIERIDGKGDIEGETGELQLRVVCSKGTYIRTLAADIGKKLGCGAYLSGLRRIRSGCFSIENSLSPEVFSLKNARDYLRDKALSVDEVRNLLH